MAVPDPLRPTALLIRGGRVVEGGMVTPADVLVEGEQITTVGRIAPQRAAGAQVLEADGRLVMPGFVDAHSHAEGAVFDEDVQLALLRQGVTSVIGGQDGVSYAPATVPTAAGTSRRSTARTPPSAAVRWPISWRPTTPPLP